MNKFIEYFLNWWVTRPSNIFVNGITCSVPPDHWMTLSWVNFLFITLFPVLISIILCYTTTSKLGKPFLIRWWLFNLLTAVIVSSLIYVYMMTKIFVCGTSDSQIFWNIPSFMILNRCIVGFLQAIVYYFIFSVIIVKMLGGVFRISKFNSNLSYPFPKLFKP